MAQLRLPQPPTDQSNETLRRSLTDIITVLRQILQNGSRHASFTQDQIDSFTDFSFLGTIVQNSDTGESNVSYLDGGVVKWRSF